MCRYIILAARARGCIRHCLLVDMVPYVPLHPNTHHYILKVYFVEPHDILDSCGSMTQATLRTSSLSLKVACFQPGARAEFSSLISNKFADQFSGSLLIIVKHAPTALLMAELRFLNTTAHQTC